MVILSPPMGKNSRAGGLWRRISVLAWLAATGCVPLLQFSRLAEAQAEVKRGECGNLERRLFELESLSAPSESQRASMAVLRGRCLELAGNWEAARIQYHYASARAGGGPGVRTARELLAQMRPGPASRDGAPAVPALSDDESGILGTGYHDPAVRQSLAFGAPRIFRLCILRTPGVGQHSIEAVIRTARTELALYDLQVQTPWVRTWGPEWESYRSLTRMQSEIMDALLELDLPAPCDRILALVHVSLTTRAVQSPGVLVSMLRLPAPGGSRQRGAVETWTRTRGYVLVGAASLIESPLDLAVHLLRSPFRGLRRRENPESFPPWDVAGRAVHEVYHMLGCGHRRSLEDCYRKIALLKDRAAQSPDPDGFFPSYAFGGGLVLHRETVRSTTARGRAHWFNAANAGDVERLRALLAKGMDVDACSPDEATALFYAAAFGRSDAVALLLARGASQIVRSDGSDAALWVAERESHAGIAGVLRRHATEHPGWKRVVCDLGPAGARALEAMPR